MILKGETAKRLGFDSTQLVKSGRRNLFRRAKVTEWSIVTVCKTVARLGYPGSNPGLGTQPTFRARRAGFE